MASYFRSKGEPTKVRSIGRLDKETSGILLFARNQTAAARLQNQREEGISEKTYLAAVSGFMPVDEDGAFHRISVPLAPDPDNRLKMVVKAAVKYIAATSRSFNAIKNENERMKFVLAAYNAGIGHAGF